MNNTAYILHSTCDKEEYFDAKYPSLSNFHWLPWLQKQLLIKGYNCQTPEMPSSYKPTYDEWKSHFDIYPVNKNTILIGHSAGAGFLLKWLSENKQPIKKLIMVAPWLDPNHENGNFLQCTLGEDLEQYIDEIHIFYSIDDDTEGVTDTINILINKYPNIKLHKFETMGHFCLGDMKTDKFPELLAVI